MSNSLEPDQAQHFVGLDLVLNCLQRLSADDGIKGTVILEIFFFKSQVSFLSIFLHTTQILKSCMTFDLVLHY